MGVATKYSVDGNTLFFSVILDPFPRKTEFFAVQSFLSSKNFFSKKFLVGFGATPRNSLRHSTQSPVS
jgi:hypothetical protein